jgi:hypothetical protein
MAGKATDGVCDSLTEPESPRRKRPRLDNDFPWRKLTTDEVLADFTQFVGRVQAAAVVFPIGICFAGYKCSDWAFDRERLSVASRGNPSCVQMWRDDHEMVKAYAARQGNGGNILASVRFLARAPAHFPPNVAAMMYRHLGCRRVYDPYAGWGDRCVAAMARGLDYLGVDSNPALASCYRELLTLLPHSGDVRFVSGRSENVPLGDFRPDLVFTSPPFWTTSHKLLEAYPECDVDEDRFVRTSLLPMMHAMLPSAGVVLYLNESLYRAVERVFGPAQVFKFTRMVVRSDPFGDCLLYWPARAARNLCRSCGSTDAVGFEPGKKSQCRSCANQAKRARKAATKLARCSGVAIIDVEAASAAREAVFAWRHAHGCVARGPANEVVYDLYNTTRRLLAADALSVTLPGPHKGAGTELRLRFSSVDVMRETIGLFQAINRRYNELK